LALTVALYCALNTGQGRDVDVTPYDVAVHLLSYPATWYLNEGDATARQPPRRPTFGVSCELFPTADGHIFVMCVLPKFRQALCAIIQAPGLPADPRFATPEARRANCDALVAILDAALQTHPTGHWMAAFAGRVPAAPVLTLLQALDNPYLADMGGIATPGHPLRPGLRTLASPIRLDGQRAVARPGPTLGADTGAVLEQAGFDAAARAALAADGIIGGQW